ncbi:hypothetical protein MU852_07080 [Brevundimonas albigilva]|uniref:hypothetical protein n=1 Tax=Brevundimonas albigilva TaxID=1312364 RepID=UPI00201B9189|nr:hypothetical protein [Brevundimonas albigilva]UQV19514.1 hypothetical protein MU852_07080 [Brevundimonas albigilva]
MNRVERYEDLPGQARIFARPAPAWPAMAAFAGAAWPPLILTLPFWPPVPGRRGVNWTGV